MCVIIATLTGEKAGSRMRLVSEEQPMTFPHDRDNLDGIDMHPRDDLAPARGIASGVIIMLLVIAGFALVWIGGQL